MGLSRGFEDIFVVYQLKVQFFIADGILEGFMERMMTYFLTSILSIRGPLVGAIFFTFTYLALYSVED